MSSPALSPALTQQVLAYLGCERRKPSVAYLNELIRGCFRHVPWESASRIVKRHTTPDTAQCPRWPEEFWNVAMSCGTGGSCFEHNLAFFSLLTSLGFEGYLTVNDMGEKIACHAALVIFAGGQKYLVDTSIPIYCALPLQRERVTRRNTPLHHYSVRPAGESTFEIERSHHPKRNMYTLIDRPVALEAFKGVVERDYEPTGYFLDRVILIKVIGERAWRFNSPEQPYHIEGFRKTDKHDILLDEKTLAHALSKHFGMAEEIIAAALDYVGSGEN